MTLSLHPPADGRGILTRLGDRLRRWRDGRIADPAFQAWAARNPLTRRVANRQAERLYDLVAGFTYSQTLLAVVQLDLLRKLAPGPMRAEELAAGTPLSPVAMTRLAQAAAALDLLTRRGGRYGIGPLGAALLGAPGVEDMIRHHPMFYRDLEDPVALLSAQHGSTELSRFWAYVAPGAGGVAAPEAAAYSRLMAASQAMVAAETLAVCPLKGVRHMVDVGGGEGAFLIAALQATPGLTGTVFDLPEVAARATVKLQHAGLSGRASAEGGSFLDGSLPQGGDAISLVRVLYDHDTEVVEAILAAVFAALPPGGRLILSEPMSGGAAPTRAGDVYFGLYTAAMTSGTPRAPETHRALLLAAGFADIRLCKARQGFITRVLTARRPG
ncbi:methyltransferase [Oceanibium sediminis]|uniref:methyltransferase n=1 Tax=Oceanibium sediminis TaxID=2026339 RepID=UPI000DD460D9|nr:methyltransferase [Oceanibium sediminis]